jgi:hypothetical protein
MKSEDLCEFHRHGTLGLEGKHVVEEEGDAVDSGSAASAEKRAGRLRVRQSRSIPSPSPSSPRRFRGASADLIKNPGADPRRRAGKKVFMKNVK